MSDERLYQSIAGKIEALIDSGKYPAGSRLPAERELAERFGVSRVAVREAQIALQAVGRIKIKTGSGAYVLDRQTDAKSTLPNVSAFELTEARALFEAEAAALAAVQIDDATLAQLERYIEIMANTRPDDKAGELADRDFHRAVASASGNAAITHVIETLWSLRTDLEPVKAVYDSVCSEDFGARAPEHAAILDALRARDPAAARVAMRNHFTRLLKSMLDVTEERALEELRRQASKSRQRYLKSATL
jgi:GntR family transcriptional regulator, hexuronate regulon transcriptional repressor